MRKFNKLHRTAKWAIPAAAFGVGAVVGWLAKAEFFVRVGRTDGREIHERGGYAYINPLLECEVDLGQSQGENIVRAKTRVEKIVEAKRQRGQVDHVSVYFRDLKQGHWYGINEMEVFEPASLVKVPLMMVYFKLAERSPGLLSQKVTFDFRGFHDLNRYETFRSTEHVVPGRTYTIEELIYRMVVYSDNNAYYVLKKNLDPQFFDKMLAELGIAVEYFDGEDKMPLKAYASFFRVLYNASYLNREYSEKALAILKDVTFPEGIEAGLPPGTKFANKFGERSTGRGNRLRQLHDCGIVYYPQHPYLLCIMTRGSDFGPLRETLREISRAAYEEVSGGAFHLTSSAEK